MNDAGQVRALPGRTICIMRTGEGWTFNVVESQPGGAANIGERHFAHSFDLLLRKLHKHVEIDEPDLKDTIEIWEP